MAAVCCLDHSCHIQIPRIVLPSARPCPPPRCSCGQDVRLLGHRGVNLIVRSQVRVENIVEVTHNKVLMAAAVSGAIGQLAKPFTRVFLSGRVEEEREKKTGFDLRAAIESGGFPSSHTSAVMATVTSLLLERGFADSIFGLSVVYAAIVMYDAQGVRREVGKHARVLNKKHQEARTSSTRSSSPESEKNAESVTRWHGSAAAERQGQAVTVLTAGEEEEEEMMMELMKEGVGHTEVEVVAGAILGMSVSLFVYNLV